MPRPRLLHVLPAHPAADDANPGTPARPLRTIAAAASRAGPGDTVRIGPGVYRERVAPARGGTADAPVTYEAITSGSAVLKGSDLWRPRLTRVPGRPELRRAKLPRALARGSFNPFGEKMPDRLGDRCRGEVFLDGRPLREVDRVDDLDLVPAGWCPEHDGTALLVKLRPADLAVADRCTWEIVTRPYVFAPRIRGLGYVVVRGLVIEHCANPFPRSFWEPGGVPQAGALSTRSGHHWTVERCTVRFAKGLGLDCGAEGGRDPEGDQPKPPLTGYHVIRDNLFLDHGVGGIAGWETPHTVIAGNTVLRCNRLGFFAPEAAGIKVHQFFHGRIEGNLVADNDAFGIWVDNGHAHSRVSRNTCLRNRGAGVFIEMGRGPCLVDHNVCAGATNGEGVYCHDASDVTIAHNLLYANSHCGVYVRKVTGRRCMDDLDPPAAEVGAARLRVVNNLFIDNHRAQLCLPYPDAPHCAGNVADHNVYIAGASWHWEGARSARFILTANDGRVPRESADAFLRAAGLDPAAVPPGDDPVLTLDEWRRATGWDTNSRTLHVGRGTIEVGAVAKGAFGLAFHDGYFHVRDGAPLAGLRVPRERGAEIDYHGRRRRGARTQPGPFAEIKPGLNRFPLECTAAPS